MKYAIGIIGFGVMGSAIAEKLRPHFDIIVFDKDKAKTAALLGTEVSKDLHAIIADADTLILAVKPQNFPEVFAEIQQIDKLIVTIAAGITTGYIEGRFGAVRVVRVMPNMPSRIGAGISCLAKGQFASEEDLDFTEKIFGRLGKTLRIKESMMNAATAISGSGPAYVYHLIERQKFDAGGFRKELKSLAEGVGFTSEEAAMLSEATINGALAVLEKTKLPAAELKKQVASKGGTTEAALKVLDSGGSWEEAVRAAIKRGEELSNG